MHSVAISYVETSTHLTPTGTHTHTQDGCEVPTNGWWTASVVKLARLLGAGYGFPDLRDSVKYVSYMKCGQRCYKPLGTLVCDPHRLTDCGRI
jgi:hypothetical protein